jgi:hypothetical protein
MKIFAFFWQTWFSLPWGLRICVVKRRVKEMGRMDPTSRDWRIGYQRLLTAPRDLLVCGARIWTTNEEVRGSSIHQRLFQEYTHGLRLATKAATRWWEGMIAHQLKRVGQLDKVLRDVWTLYPAGPASDAGFVSVIRKYWLACDSLNLTCASSERVSPEIFLLKWLADVGEDECLKLVTFMPYWPIGLDREGNWV